MEHIPIAFYGKVFRPYDYDVASDNKTIKRIPYTEDNPAPTIIILYDGIYQKKSTRSDIFYPSLRSIGRINVTTRTFYKSKHYKNKIIQQNDDNVILFSYGNDPEDHRYTKLHLLCRQLGYTDEFIDEMINVIIKNTYGSKIQCISGISF
jgi:hypothetical protein